MSLVEILRAVFGLAFVLGLIALCAYAARRSPLAFGLARGKKAPGRLAIAERLMLDPRRQIVVLRDGTREHVILLGMSAETLIESRDAACDAAPAPLRLIEPGSAP